MPRVRRLVTTVALVCVAGVAGLVGARWVGEALQDPRCEFRAADRMETLTPEQSANASTMSLVAVRRDLPPRAATIAIATSIQESKLRNINYGDADSLGLFQQRPSQGWGQADQILDSVYASDVFYDALVQISGWQDGEITEVAQSVQRSAYPEAYADHEWQGRVIASVLTGETTAGVGCALDEPGSSGDAPALAAEVQALGFTATADGDEVTMSTSDGDAAWALAGWALTHAEGREITEVQVDGRSWSRDDDPLSWRTDPAAPQDTTTVIVRLNP